MPIYFCRRAKADWSGGLIIYGHNEDEARKFFTDKEGEEPYSVRELPLPTCPEKAILIYDDLER